MLTVSITSWHYRVYRHWLENIARKQPKQIDLCHYMRAIMLFTPGYYIGLGLLYAGIGLACAIAAIVLALTSPLWVPFWLLKRRRPGWHKRAGARLFSWVDPFGEWLREHGDRMAIGLCVGAGVLAFVLLTLDEWWKGILSLGVLLAAVVVVTLLVLGAVAFHDWYNQPHKRDARRAKRIAQLQEKANRPPKPDKGPGALRLLWVWIRAKKKRICPLIQTNAPKSSSDSPIST